MCVYSWYNITWIKELMYIGVKTKMNTNRKMYFYQGKKPPFYFFPLALILFALVVAILVVFGLFIGIVVGAFIVLFSVLRLISSIGKKKVRKTENGGTTVILEEGDYEVIEKEKDS